MNRTQAIQYGQKMLKQKSEKVIIVQALLQWVLKVSKEQLITEEKIDIAESEWNQFEKAIQEVKNGKPVAYITESKEFYGRKFYINEHVLIPRPETEHIVEYVLKVLNKKKEYNLLDVGTGSGVIGITLALELPLTTVTLNDISSMALEVARKNVHLYGLENRVQFSLSDLLESLAEKKFDIIVTNLPYIGEKEFRYIHEEVEDYEPHIALFGGKDGLDLYRKLFYQIIKLKYKPKLIVGEFGFAQSERMQEILNTHFKNRWKIIKDYSDIDRIFIITWMGKNDILNSCLKN